MSDSWEQRWAQMSPENQRGLWERIAVTPLRMAFRPLWKRLLVSPHVWWKHYKLSRKYGGRLHSIRWAFVWTGLLLFPKWFEKQEFDDV